MMRRFKDKLWIWGHTAGAHNHFYQIKGESVMTPVEGANYLGAQNIFMIVHKDNPKPPFDKYSKSMETMSEVKWSVVGDGGSKEDNAGYGNLDEVIRQSILFPNVTGGIFDDFFSPERMKEYTPEKLKYMRDRLHKNESKQLDMWCVIYNHDLDKNIGIYLNEFDGVIFWTWKESELSAFEENYRKFLSITQHKKRMLGCYLYNYGEAKETTIEMIDFQLNRYRRCIYDNEIEGIVFCSNTVIDLGLPAVGYAKEWIAKHGEDLIVEVD